MQFFFSTKPTTHIVGIFSRKYLRNGHYTMHKSCLIALSLSRCFTDIAASIGLNLPIKSNCKIAWKSWLHRLWLLVLMFMVSCPSFPLPCLLSVMSMHWFYRRETAFSHILTLMHFRDLQHHLDSFNTFTFLNSEMSCTHVNHLWMFYHVSMHHASAHLWIFDNHPQMHYMLPEPLHIHRHTSLHIPSYSRYTISHLWTSSCMKAHICWISGIIHAQHTEYSQHLGNVWTPIHLVPQHS